MEGVITTGVAKTGVVWIDMLTRLDGSLNVAVLCVTIMLSFIVMRKLKKAKKFNGWRWLVPMVMAQSLYALWAYSTGNVSKIVIWGGLSTGAWAIFLVSVFKSMAKAKKWKFKF